MGGRLEGVLRALRTVNASRAEERETARIWGYAEESAVASVRAVKIEAVAWTVSGAGVNLAVMLILGLGAWRVSTGALSVSALVAFLLYVFQLMMPVMLLTMSLTSLQSGLAPAARIAQIDQLRLESDDPASRTPSAGPAPHPSDHPALALHGVTYRYSPEAEPALDDVSITIPRRGHTAIVGPSGAGKTTVFSLLLEFMHPERGS